MNDIKTLYDDKDIVIVSKPHGLHCIPDRYGEQSKTLKGMLQSKYPNIYSVHRLDAGTGGVMVYAKTPAIHKILCGYFEKGLVEKSYLACVNGILEYPFSTMLPISSTVSHGKYKINFKSGKKCLTTFLPLKHGDNSTLVNVIPLTGRTHQIRVHLKTYKYPLVKDWVYNSRSQERRITLFSHILRFKHPSNGIDMKFHAPLSDFFISECAEKNIYIDDRELEGFIK